MAFERIVKTTGGSTSALPDNYLRISVGTKGQKSKYACHTTVGSALSRLMGLKAGDRLEFAWDGDKRTPYVRKMAGGSLSHGQKLKEVGATDGNAGRYLCNTPYNLVTKMQAVGLEGSQYYTASEVRIDKENWYELRHAG